MMGDGWGMGWMWLVWPLSIAIVVLVIVLVFRAVSPGGIGDAPRTGDRRSRAQEILDERYARGELTDDQYQERLRNLRGSVTDR
jgi:putative membrane protein